MLQVRTPADNGKILCTIQLLWRASRIPMASSTQLTTVLVITLCQLLAWRSSGRETQSRSGLPNVLTHQLAALLDYRTIEQYSIRS